MPRTRIGSFHLVRERAGRTHRALARLVTDRPELDRTAGLRFWRVLGTGRGASTAPGVDPRRTALFAVWEDEADLDRFLERSPIAARWPGAEEHYTVRLRALGGHGSWRGLDVLDGLVPADLPKDVAIDGSKDAPGHPPDHGPGQPRIGAPGHPPDHGPGQPPDQVLGQPPNDVPGHPADEVLDDAPGDASAAVSGDHEGGGGADAPGDVSAAVSGDHEGRGGADAPVAVLTRAVVRPHAWLAFLRASRAVSEEVAAAPGLLAVVGVGEAPIGRQATFSLWRRGSDALAFAYGGARHAAVIRSTRHEHWYGEELFARFQPYVSEGTWDGSDPLGP